MADPGCNANNLGVIDLILIPPALTGLAAAQEGVVSRAQALDIGFSRHSVSRLLRDGAWQRLTEGIYLTHSGPTSWAAQAWAGVLLGGPDAMLADEAAGYLWRIEPDPPTLISVLVPNESHPEQNWPWRFRRTRNLPRAHGSPPRTPLPDTVIDLCLLQPHRQLELLAGVLSRGRTTEGALLKVMDARRTVKDRKLLEAVLGRVRDGIHSELEDRYARDVERAHGLPRGKRQVYDGRYRVDVRYGLRLLVELDGRKYHSGEAAFRDMARDNAHLLRGELTLRYGWFDVTTDPCGVARQVAEMLIQLGEPVDFHPCPRCREA